MSIRRTLGVIVSLTLLLSIVNGTIATAQSASGSSKRDPIMEGLWAGANLNINFYGQTNTSRNRPSSSTSTSKPIYAALGDSVAAGQGLPAGDNDTRCDRSTESYTHTVAKNRKLTLVHAACSGATVGDLVTQQGVSGPNPKPQLDVAFTQGTPRLITITAGANDLEWFSFLGKCRDYTCGTAFDDAAISSLRSIMYGKYYYALSEIYLRSDRKPPKVVITGYYNPLASRCDSIRNFITANELRWIGKQVQGLNKTLQDVSKQFSFARFAPVSFGGHDLCSRSPWVQDLNDAAPLHPTKRGQEAIAQSVLRAL